MTEIQENAPEVAVHSDEDILNNILGNLPAEVAVDVDIPSLGVVYGNSRDTKKVSVTPMTFDDEKAILSSQKDPSIDPANLLLSRCVNGVKVDDLLIMDKLYLIMKIRELSFGNEYKSRAICKKCKAENNLSIELDKLLCNFVDEHEFMDPTEVELPQIGKTAKVRVPRVCDEQYLMDPERTVNELWRFVDEIGGSQNKKIIAKVIEKLPIIDVHKIINVLTMQEYGIQTEVKFVCSHCQSHETIILPISANFFSTN